MGGLAGGAHGQSSTGGFSRGEAGAPCGSGTSRRLHWFRGRAPRRRRPGLGAVGAASTASTALTASATTTSVAGVGRQSYGRSFGNSRGCSRRGCPRPDIVCRNPARVPRLVTLPHPRTFLHPRAAGSLPTCSTACPRWVRRANPPQVQRSCGVHSRASYASLRLAPPGASAAARSAWSPVPPSGRSRSCGGAELAPGIRRSVRKRLERPAAWGWFQWWFQYDLAMVGRRERRVVGVRHWLSTRAARMPLPLVGMSDRQRPH
jgi:hypothetical protein